MFPLLKAAQRALLQVRAAQVPDQMLLRAVGEQVVSSGVSGCDLRVCWLIRAEQALIRGAFFA
ncbi:hypothetical protein AUW26_28215 [Streptomyces sp. CC71]|nr:hypothetical protein AUW26_28215 [Streptomyces sp. CC71]